MGMAAMVLAAGLGTRMRPLTETRPKALLPVAGRALVDHAIARARAAGLSPIVVNIHHFPEQMRAHLAGRGVILSDETDRLLDTGGALRRALPWLGDGPFVSLNADAIWLGPDPIAPMIAAWDGARMDGIIQVVAREAARGYKRTGDFFLDGDGHPSRPVSGAAPFVYTGAQMLTARAFDGVGVDRFSANLVWDRLMAAGRLHAVEHRGPWVDVGTPAGLAEAEAALAHG